MDWATAHVSESAPILSSHRCGAHALLVLVSNILDFVMDVNCSKIPPDEMCLWMFVIGGMSWRKHIHKALGVSELKAPSKLACEPICLLWSYPWVRTWKTIWSESLEPLSPSFFFWGNKGDNLNDFTSNRVSKEEILKSSYLPNVLLSLYYLTWLQAALQSSLQLKCCFILFCSRDSRLLVPEVILIN